MVIQLLFFWYWSNFVLPNLQNDKEQWESHDNVCSIVLPITAFYLLIVELSQVIKRRIQYFYSPTRLFNLFTPITIIVNVFNKHGSDSGGTNFFWTIQSWTAIFIWFRFLLYLRTTNKYSWIIRMISECFNDMITFLLVFFIGILAFADAFLSVEVILVNDQIISPIIVPEDASFYEKYV